MFCIFDYTAANAYLQQVYLQFLKIRTKKDGDPAGFRPLQDVKADLPDDNAIHNRPGLCTGGPKGMYRTQTQPEPAGWPD